MPSRYEVPDTTVVFASSEDMSIFKGIESVRGQAPITVAMTPYDPIEQGLTELGIPHIIVPRGNLGKTFNAAISLAETPKVIVMEDEATFAEGALAALSEGLDTYDVCKPNVIFEHDPTRPSTRWVAEARDFINVDPTRAYTPGLAMNLNIKDRMGGHYFDEQVLWGEDAEFSHRMHDNGLSFGVIEGATVTHPPVTMNHDLKGSFILGVAKRRAVDLGVGKPKEDILPTLRRVLTGETAGKKLDLLREKGLATTGFAIAWDAAYNLGYNAARLGVAAQTERLLWRSFGRTEPTFNKKSH